MRQAILLFAIFFLSALMAIAQTSDGVNGQATTSTSTPAGNQTNQGTTNTAPAPPSVNVTDVAQANGTQPVPATTTAGASNAATTPAVVEPRVVTTPSVSLGVSPVSPVGASNATQGNQAGASNSTLAPNSSGMEVSNPGSTTPQLPNINTSAPAIVATTNIGFVGSPESAYSASGEASVAEAARRYRNEKAMRHPHVYTNADIARLSRGLAPPVANQNTMPASDVTTPQGATAAATPANEQSVTAPPTQNNPAVRKKSPFASKPAPPKD